MNSIHFLTSDIIGLAIILFFGGLVLFFGITGRRKANGKLREIEGFVILWRVLGQAVETGQRVHFSFGWGGVIGTRAASAFSGLALFRRIARLTVYSDKPQIATSGDGALAILSQDRMQSIFRESSATHLFEPDFGQVSGLTPYSYAVGCLPVIYDQHISVTMIMGHVGSEVAYLADASAQSGGVVIAGSDSLSAQSILYAGADNALIGEELFAAGAYIEEDLINRASVQAEDILRWVIVLIVLVGAVLKIMGAL